MMIASNIMGTLVMYLSEKDQNTHPVLILKQIAEMICEKEKRLTHLIQKTRNCHDVCGHLLTFRSPSDWVAIQIVLTDNNLSMWTSDGNRTPENHTYYQLEDPELFEKIMSNIDLRDFFCYFG